jgi:hypothetical protein
MSQTPYKRRGFPVPMRWLHADGDLSQSHPSSQKCLLHSPDLPYVQKCSWPHPGVPSISDIGAGIKSP